MDRLHWAISSPEERQAAMDECERSLAVFEAMSHEQFMDGFRKFCGGELPEMCRPKFEEVDSKITGDEPDLCGLCGRVGADNKPYRHYAYWPGELIPLTALVHKTCEVAERHRAYDALTEQQRKEFRKSSGTGTSSHGGQESITLDIDIRM